LEKTANEKEGTLLRGRETKGKDKTEGEEKWINY